MTLSTASSPAAAAVRYSVTSLSTPDASYVDAEGLAINNSGVVGGYAFHSTWKQAIAWNPAASAAYSPTVLGNLGIRPGEGVAYGTVEAINSGGTLAGFSAKSSGSVDLGVRAVTWSAGSTVPFELPVLTTTSTGNTVSAVTAINDSGMMAGYARRHSGDTSMGFRPVRWDPSTSEIVELRMLDDIQDSGTFVSGHVWGINGTGVAVGDSRKNINGNFAGTRAVRWDAGSTTPTELGTLVSFVGSTAARARAINDAGTIVGSALTSGSSSRAVKWASDSTVAIPLPADSADGVATSATDINQLGQIVGYGWNGEAAVALFWEPDAAMAIDLNTLIDPNSGWKLISANSINDHGQIAGFGTYDPDGSGAAAAADGAFLLTVVPEPTGLLTLAGVGLFALRRARRQ